MPNPKKQAVRKLTNVLNNELVKSSSAVLLIRAANVLCAISLSIIMIRSLGMIEFGFFAMYMAIFSLAVLPLTSGMPNFIVKEVSQNHIIGNLAEIKGVISYFFRASAMYFALLALIVAVSLLVLAPEYWPFAIILWLHTAIQILNAGRSALLRAIGKVVKGQLIDRLIQPALSIALVGSAWIILGSNFHVLHAIIAILSSTILSFAVGAYWVRVEIGAQLSGVEPCKPKDDWFGLVTNLSGAGFLGSAFMNGVVLMVGWIGSLEAAALFRVASALAIVFNYVQEVMLQVVAPRVAQLWHVRDTDGLVRILAIGAMFNSTVIAVGTAALALFGKNVLEIAYGAETRNAYTALIILSLGNLAIALGGYRDLLLNMSGHAKAAFRISAVTVPFSLTLAAALTFLLDQNGAAAAVLCFHIAGSVWSSLATRRLTGIDPSILGFLTNAAESKTSLSANRTDRP